MKVALVAGATGLIGKQLLQLLLADPEYHRVKAVSRHPISGDNPRFENIIADFDALADLENRLKADVVFCCLGSTMKKAGSKDAFSKVDYVYPLELGKVALAHGASQYLIVSALGADPSSSVFYNKVKGEVERAVSALGYPSVHIFRPSLLLGPREESRAGEDAAKVFYRIFSFLIPRKYKGIEGVKVARAMVHFAREEKPGTHIHESESLQSF